MPNRPHSLPSSQNVALRRLSNGMTVAAYENAASPAIVLSALLQVGAMDEAAAQGGLASLTASLLSRGTLAHDYDTLNEAIEGVGASVGIGGRTHTTAATARSLAEDFPTILALLAEMLRRPTFPAEQVARLRAIRLSALHERSQSPRAVADLHFYALAYPPGHPYHAPPSGTIETVERLGRDDVAHFHAAHYGPQGALVVVVGAIAPQAALDLVEAALGDWLPLPGPHRERHAPPVAWPSAAVERHSAIPGKAQSELVFGLPTIARSHPDYPLLSLANTVLGTFGMMGRIGKAVRDEQGLAYYARSSLDATHGPGAWSATAGVAPHHVARAVAAIRAEWQRLRHEPVGAAELADSKALLAGSLPLRLETNVGIAGTLTDLLAYDLGLDFLLDYEGRLEAISAEQLRDATHRHFDPERALLSTAGP